MLVDNPTCFGSSKNGPEESFPHVFGDIYNGNYVDEVSSAVTTFVPTSYAALVSLATMNIIIVFFIF